MAETYFATFNLGDTDRDGPELADVWAVVTRWLLGSRPGVDRSALSKVRLDETGDYSAGLGRVQIRRHRDADVEILGAQLAHPDEAGAMEWVAEIVTARSRGPSERMETAVSVRTGVRHLTDRVAPVVVFPSRPRLVTDLIDAFGAWDGAFKLLTVPIGLTPSDFDEHFVRALEEPSRRVPIVVVTTTNEDRTLVDTELLADRLAGLALVCEFENRFVAMRLTARLGASWSCWGGGIRVYWPGAEIDAPARGYGHVVLSRRRLEELGSDGAIAAELLGVISRAATNRAAAANVRWSDLEARIARRRLEEVRESGDTAELQRLLLDENDRLTKETRRLEDELLGAWASLARATEDATYWRKEYEAARRSVAQVEDPDEAPPANVGEALQRAAQVFPDRLEVQLNGASDAESQFEDVEGFAAALKFVATTYVDARRGTRPCADLDAACRAVSGFFYRGGQSSITVGQHPEDYETNWNGKKVALEEHLGKGTGRDPRRCLRIGIHFDRTSGKVVVGYLGQHQTTGAS